MYDFISAGVTDSARLPNPHQIGVSGMCADGDPRALAERYRFSALPSCRPRASRTRHLPSYKRNDVFVIPRFLAPKLSPRSELRSTFLFIKACFLLTEVCGSVFQCGILDIRYKHMSRCVSYCKARCRRHKSRLRSHSARPEHRNLAFLYHDRIAVIGTAYVALCRSPRDRRYARLAVDSRHRSGNDCGAYCVRAFIGRMLTTILPWNIPAGTSGIFVLYIGTLRPSSICLTGISASRSSASNEKLHPIRNETRSSRQKRSTSVYSPVISPFSYMRYFGISFAISASSAMNRREREPTSETSSIGHEVGLRCAKRRKNRTPPRAEEPRDSPARIPRTFRKSDNLFHRFLSVFAIKRQHFCIFIHSNIPFTIFFRADAGIFRRTPRHLCHNRIFSTFTATEAPNRIRAEI